MASSWSRPLLRKPSETITGFLGEKAAPAARIGGRSLPVSFRPRASFPASSNIARLQDHLAQLSGAPLPADRREGRVIDAVRPVFGEKADMARRPASNLSAANDPNGKSTGVEFGWPGRSRQSDHRANGAVRDC
jgi:hypothetical protein